MTNVSIKTHIIGEDYNKLSYIIYFNCGKNNYHTNTSIKPKKDFDTSEN